LPRPFGMVQWYQVAAIEAHHRGKVSVDTQRRASFSSLNRAAGYLSSISDSGRPLW
jgi:molybdopterin-guanine dinucleotide biosynthesis protein